MSDLMTTDVLIMVIDINIVSPIKIVVATREVVEDLFVVVKLGELKEYAYHLIRSRVNFEGITF